MLCMENPESCVATKLVDTVLNKNNQYSHRCPVFTISWMPDGRGLVAGNSQGEFTLWDGYEFNFLTIWQGHDQAVQSTTWSHHGEFMVSGDKTGIIKYWMVNMNEVKKIQGHKDAIRALSFSPSDLKLVSGGDDCNLKLWDFETGREERAIKGHHWDVKCAEWHPTKPLILSGGKDHKVKLWDARSGTCLDTIHAHKNTVRACRWTINGNMFVTAGRDQKIKLYDLRRTAEALVTFAGHKAEVTALAMHPQHETLFASGDFAGAVSYWSTNSENPVAHRSASEHDSHTACIWALEWHPLGHLLCSASNDHTCKFWSRNRPGEGIGAPPVLASTPAGERGRGGGSWGDRERDRGGYGGGSYSRGRDDRSGPGGPGSGPGGPLGGRYMEGGGGANAARARPARATALCFRRHARAARYAPPYRTPRHGASSDGRGAAWLGWRRARG